MERSEVGGMGAACVEEGNRGGRAISPYLPSGEAGIGVGRRYIAGW